MIFPVRLAAFEAICLSGRTNFGGAPAIVADGLGARRTDAARPKMNRCAKQVLTLLASEFGGYSTFRCPAPTPQQTVPKPHEHGSFSEKGKWCDFSCVGSLNHRPSFLGQFEQCRYDEG